MEAKVPDPFFPIFWCNTAWHYGLSTLLHTGYALRMSFAKEYGWARRIDGNTSLHRRNSAMARVHVVIQASHSALGPIGRHPGSCRPSLCVHTFVLAHIPQSLSDVAV